jgi:exopolysaccharide production protein ExoY
LASISILGRAPSRSARNELKWRIAETCERVASLGMAIALGPAIAIAGAGAALLSGRTPLIAHRRVGWRARTLWLLKLRTMWGIHANASGSRRGWIEYIDDTGGLDLKGSHDPRVTSRFARFCRRHSIDEIPQLWHVIRGEMSLVGPRPMTAEELRRYYGDDADEILQHKPGITGLWQVRGRNRVTYHERRNLDLELIRHTSLRMYLKILLNTIPEVISGRNTY